MQSRQGKKGEKKKEEKTRKKGEKKGKTRRFCVHIYLFNVFLAV